jgi:hypothetical protein
MITADKFEPLQIVANDTRPLKMAMIAIAALILLVKVVK